MTGSLPKTLLDKREDIKTLSDIKVLEHSVVLLGKKYAMGREYPCNIFSQINWQPWKPFPSKSLDWCYIWSHENSHKVWLNKMTPLALSLNE